MDALNCTRYTCEGCNALFESNRPKRYCTRKCNKQHLQKIGSQSTRSEYIANIRENAASKFYCACCGIEARRKLGGSNKAKGYANKHCSMACRFSQVKRVRLELEFLQRLGRAHCLKSVSQARSIAAIRSVSQALTRYTNHREKAERLCSVCGSQVGYTFGRAKLFCSKSCRKKTESFKVAKKAARPERVMGRGENFIIIIQVL